MILGSLLGDLPMSRVKFGAKHEYEFIANFKVMQNVFKAKKIDKVRDGSRFLRANAEFSLANTSGKTCQMQDAVCSF